MKKFITFILIILMLPILFVNFVIILDSILNSEQIPSFFGWKGFVVLSGSMEKTILPGDLIIVKEIDNEKLEKNDVIAFKDEEVVITHRIVDVVKEDGTVKYVTKGDNNNTNDIGYVFPEEVEGIYKFRIGRLGNLALFVQNPLGMILCLSIPLILLLLINIKESKENKKYIRKKEKEQKQLEEEIIELRKQNEELQREKIIK